MLRKWFGVGALEPRKFVDLVVELGVEKGVWTNPNVDYDAMTVVEGKDVTNLRNIYAMFLRVPRRERLAYLENAISIRRETENAPQTWEDVRPLLRPVLREGGYLLNTELGMRVRDPEMVTRLAYRDFAPGLFATLAIDFPHAMMLASQDHLTTWGVDFETALDAAISNLRAASQDPFEPIRPGVWVAPWTDSYTAARLVLPEVLQRVCTDPLVCAPTRDFLFVADNTPGGFDALVELLLSEKVAEAPYSLTSRIYQLENKTLRRAEPPRDSQRIVDYERMCILQDQASYAEESQLRAALEPEAFYAQLMVFQLPDGSLRSRAVWPRGADPSYLPPAQAIFFTYPDAQ